MLNPQLGCRRQQGRQDLALRLSVSSSARAPVALPGDPERTINFNSFPWCLAFTVTIAHNEARYLMKIQRPFGGESGSLKVGNEEITFTLEGKSAIFLPSNGRFTRDDYEVIHLQICVNSDGRLIQL